MMYEPFGVPGFAPPPPPPPPPLPPPQATLPITSMHRTTGSAAYDRIRFDGTPISRTPANTNPSAVKPIPGCSAADVGAVVLIETVVVPEPTTLAGLKE